MTGAQIEASPLPDGRTRAGRFRPWRGVLAVGLLAAAAVSWTAIPMSRAGAGARPTLIIAACCAALSLVQLAAANLFGSADANPVNPEYLLSWPELQLARAWAAIRTLGWAQGVIMALLILEAMHPARPWHTAVLGAALLGYLLAIRLAEDGEGPGTLRPQLPVIISGLCLTALAAAANLLPASGLGAGSRWFAAIAAVAAVIVAGLVLPV